jgi:PLP dependent protein
MHQSVQNLINIKEKIKQNNQSYNNINIIAVSKTFTIEKVAPLLNYGHNDFGENKVQEAIEKWTEIKNKNNLIKLHLIGKLQTNKVKYALKIFDYIHSLDSKKLAKKIADEQLKLSKKLKIFIQVNIGSEEQKSGVSVEELEDLYKYSINLGLDIIGLMCIPPVGKKSDDYFKKLKLLNDNLSLNDLSMGMSSDYISAINNNATYLRIGSEIFGKRD